MKIRVEWIVILIGFIYIGGLSSAKRPLSGSAAQSSAPEFAAILTVTYPEVEIRRANTSEWIALPREATTPFGSGDTVRTGRNGRAYLEFFEAKALVLPESTYTLMRFEGESDTQFTLYAQSSGRSVYFIPPTITLDDFRLEAGNWVMETPSQQFAIQTAVFDEDDFVVSAVGNALVRVDGEAITVAEREGLRISDDGDEVITIEADLINFARIEGWLDGCVGVVDTAGDVSLRVRAGPGTNFYYMGSLPNASQVQLMGVNFSNGESWYLAQFLSDFGWIQASAIQTDCENVPDIPRSIVTPNNIFDAMDREIAILQVFYGTPSSNVWFYQ